jgi:hypothetical protein
LLTLVLAGALSAVAVGFAWRALERCRELTGVAGRAQQLEALEESGDELELRLAEREARLMLGLALRNVLGLGRAALFGGTGCAVWELTSGSSHYLYAGGAFGLGFLGWAGCGEAHRRLGSLAGAQGMSRKSRR